MKHTLKTLIAIGSAVAMLAVPAFASADQGTHLRSPDGTDGGGPVASLSLQSADAQDSAHATAAADNPVPVQARADDGSDWVLPVAGALAAVALAFGVALVASRRKHHAVSA